MTQLIDQEWTAGFFCFTCDREQRFDMASYRGRVWGVCSRCGDFLDDSIINEEYEIEFDCYD